MTREDILFALYKDKATNGSKEFKEKLKKYKKEVNLTDLYTRVINYQIDKYGVSLDTVRDTNTLVDDMYFDGKINKHQKYKGRKRWNKQ